MSNNPWDSFEDVKSSNTNTYPTGNQDYRASMKMDLGSNPNKDVSNDDGYLKKAGNLLKSGSLGLLQGASNAAASVGNIPLEAFNSVAGTNYKIPPADLQQYTAQDPYNRALFSGAELAGGMVPGIGAFSKIGKALNMTPSSSMILRALQGAGEGYATNEYGLGGREGGAIAGGLMGGIPQLSNKNLSSRILNEGNDAINKSRSDYTSLLTDASKRNINGSDIVMPTNDFDYGILKKNIPDLERKSIDKYLSNPTLENAHFAQSSIGTKIRNQEKKSDQNVELLNQLRSARKSIQSGIKESIPESDYKSYEKLGEDYIKNVVPFKYKSFSEFKRGDLSPSKFVKRSINQDRFFMNKGKDMNELYLRSLLNKTTKNPWVYGIAGPAAGYGIIDYIRG
jgi:hypothetical protein